LLISLLLLLDPVRAAAGDAPISVAVLAEASGVAAMIDEPAVRWSALDEVVRIQIDLDPSGALETLKTYPGLPNRFQHFASLARIYAKAGKTDETERIYAEIRTENRSSPQGKLAATETKGYLAIAYANAGRPEEAVQFVTQIKEQFRERPPSITVTALASIAEAQAKAGDLRTAIQTATAVAGEDPAPLMALVGARVRAGDLQSAQAIVAGLDEGLQRYAQWGIVQAQKDQGKLTEAQLTASAMKPGHAKAGAFLELADHYIAAGAAPTAVGLLHEAATAAASAINASLKADVLRHIAGSMAKTGETFAAIETARTIEDASRRRVAVRDIATAQAGSGDAKGALNTALILRRTGENAVEDDHDYESAVAQILAELVKAGKVQEAKAVVRNLAEADTRYRILYASIATAQANLGNIKGAKATLALVETARDRAARRKELVRLTEWPSDYLSEDERLRLAAIQDTERITGEADLALARASARSRDWRSAVAAADALSPAQRSSALRDIGLIYGKTERSSQALGWARSLPTSCDQAYALLGIARGFAARGAKYATK
jgi:hypothetical protein